MWVKCWFITGYYVAAAACLQCKQSALVLGLLMGMDRHTNGPSGGGGINGQTWGMGRNLPPNRRSSANFVGRELMRGLQGGLCVLPEEKN